MKAERFIQVTTGALFLGLGQMVLAEGMELDDLYQLRQVTQVEVSPDGEHVAYLKQVQRDPYNDENGPAWSELHVSSGEDDSRAFITGKVNINAIDWTPDSSGISFLARRGDDEVNALYVIPIAGGEAQRVFAHATPIRSYSWHPDGEKFAFLANERSEEKRRELQDRGFDARVHEERMDPVRVWIGEKNSDNDAEMLELDGSASELHWSPTGDKLAMMMAPTPLIDDHYMARQPQVVDVDSHDVVTEFDTEGKLGPMAWSSDGEHLAWVGAEDIHDPREGRLVVGNVDSGESRQIKDSSYHGHIQTMAWADEETIVWLGHRGTWSELGRSGLNGDGREILIGREQPILRSLSLSEDGEVMAFAADSPEHPREVFVRNEGELNRWTDSNPWLADRELAEQEVVTHEAADGLELEGILIRPLDEDGEHPLIMAVHGGPEAHISNGWNTNYSNPGQVAAARGYAVFYPNYRGSTARGVEFSKLGQGDAAGKEFDDLVDAKKHLVDTGLVDEDRVGITGGSYGGYASAWGATAQTEHFAASVMFVGISNTISKFGTSDIPQELMLVHSREWPWEDWEFALERSPIYHAEQSRTPIKIMHGEADTRVHVSQSMELFRILKVQDNTPVRLVTFPGEGHGNSNATSQREYAMRLMRWMDHFLVDGEEDKPEPDLDHGDRI